MSIPTTSKEFDAWMNRAHQEMPPELYFRAREAQAALRVIELNPADKIEAMKQFAPEAYAKMIRQLIEFAEAYGAWKANS